MRDLGKRRTDQMSGETSDSHVIRDQDEVLPAAGFPALVTRLSRLPHCHHRRLRRHDRKLLYHGDYERVLSSSFFHVTCAQQEQENRTASRSDYHLLVFLFLSGAVPGEQILVPCRDVRSGGAGALVTRLITLVFFPVDNECPTSGPLPSSLPRMTWKTHVTRFSFLFPS